MSSPVAPIECPHGLRPGTTVCLRCRQEARAAAHQRRVRLVARGALSFTGAAVLVVGLVAAWAKVSTKSPKPEAVLATSSGQAAPRSEPAAPVVSRRSAPPKPTPEPVIGEGRRELGDSMFAVREGPQVTVNFDTEGLRTRFDWKFEGVVRATLPVIFGPDARMALDSIPAGTLASGGGLLTELPERGIVIQMGSAALKVFPVTRPGRDGPLVVAYRAQALR